MLKYFISALIIQLFGSTHSYAQLEAKFEVNSEIACNPFNVAVTDLSGAADTVAIKAARSFLGTFGVSLIALVCMISTLGSLYSGILAIPRVHFAMARDGVFFPSIGSLSKRTHVPVIAVGLCGLLACVQVVLGTFDQLTTLVVFSLCTISGATVASVFVLRRKMPDVPRPYKTLGYPIIPFLFVIVNIWLVINTLKTNPVISLVGVVLILSGLPLYFYFRNKKRQENMAVNFDINI